MRPAGRVEREDPGPMSTDLTPAQADRRDTLVERIAGDAVGTFDLLNVYLGMRLGLFRALADGGPASSAELAAANRAPRALRPGVARAGRGGRDPRSRSGRR